MAYPVEGKGHGSNRLMYSPQGDSLILALSLFLSPSLFSAQSQTDSLSPGHHHLTPTALSPACQDFNHMAK